ncbi:MAG: tetratricopeptide repeat protein, partial [Cyanobacteria bacterium P01_F01_bin.116]
AYRTAIRLGPDDAVTYSNLGNVLKAQSRYGEAEEAHRTALRLDPDYATAYNNLGAVLNEQSRYGEAEEAYRTAIRLGPDDAVTYSNLGNVLKAQSRYGEAEEAHRTAIRLDPDDAVSYSNLGILLSEQSRYGEAEEIYRTAIRLNPDDAVSYNNLGYSYQVQGRLEEAIELYEKSMNLDPDYARPQNNLAEAKRLLSLRENPLPNRSNDLAWQPKNEPLQPLLRAVVRLVTPTASGVKYGTGWVVKRDGNRIWVVTNRHVVTQESLQQDSGASFAATKSGNLSDDISVDLYSEPPPGRTWLRLSARVVESTGPSDDLDLALVVIEDAPEDIQPLEIISTTVGLDTDIRVIGHHNDPWSLARGYVNRRPQGTVLQLAETAIGQGSSGSPVFNSENQVIGIITDIEPPNIGQGGDFLGGFSYGHPSTAIMTTLEAWNVL